MSELAYGDATLLPEAEVAVFAPRNSKHIGIFNYVSERFSEVDISNFFEVDLDHKFSGGVLLQTEK